MDSLFDPIPCILLAAGASSRMGSHKLLLSVGVETVVRRVARMVCAHDRPLIVVTGWRRMEIESALAGLEGISFAFNPDWKEGRVTSAIAGIRALSNAVPGFFLHHADMPFIDEEVFGLLERVAGERQRVGDTPVALVASRRGKAGHPVYFPASYIPAILALGKGERLKELLAKLGSLNIETNCDGVLEDMDSPEEYTTYLRKYGYDTPCRT